MMIQWDSDCILHIVVKTHRQISTTVLLISCSFCTYSILSQSPSSKAMIVVLSLLLLLMPQKYAFAYEACPFLNKVKNYFNSEFWVFPPGIRTPGLSLSRSYLCQDANGTWSKRMWFHILPLYLCLHRFIPCFGSFCQIVDSELFIVRTYFIFIYFLFVLCKLPCIMMEL